MSCLSSLISLYFCKTDMGSLSELNKSGTEGSDCHQLLSLILLRCWLLIVSLNWLFSSQCGKKNVSDIHTIPESTEDDLINISEDCWINDIDFLLQIAVSANLTLTILSKFPLFILLCRIRPMTLLNSVIFLHESRKSASEYQMAFKAAEDDENE